MEDLGGPLTREESDLKLADFAAAFERNSYGKWAVEDSEGQFLGYAGPMPSRDKNHPLGDHVEMGWRFNRSTWGNGYATEAARAAIKDAFQRVGLPLIYAYTAPDNFRSQAVMRKLHLERKRDLDFTETERARTPRKGLVWIARP